MALILTDKTDKYVPSSLKSFFCSKNFQEQFTAFKSAYKPSFLRNSQDDIIAFKNEYLRDRCLLEGDEITIALNFSTYIRNKNSASSFNSNGITRLRKDDFMWVFQSEVWECLDFKQRYTVLHWLQQSCNAKGQLPGIDFISRHFNTVSYAAGYNITHNRLFVNIKGLNHGLYIAGALLHEMEHFKQLTNQANTDLAIEVAKKCGIDLKSFLSYEYSEEKALIDKPLSGLQKPEKQELIRFKHIVSPVKNSGVAKSKVKNIKTFKKYLNNEHYYQCPLEKQAFDAQKKGIEEIMYQFLSIPNEQDSNELERAQRVAYGINTLQLTPVLKTLSNDQLIDLQDAFIQDAYYQTYVYDDEKTANHNKMAHDEQLYSIYNAVKDRDGGLSRL